MDGQQGLEGWLADPQFRTNAVRVLAIAASLLALETFIIVGPPRAAILRLFMPRDAAQQPKKAQRLVSQLAARVVGVVFLAAAMPAAFRTLGEAGVREDKLYATSESSSLTMTIATGYFVYDVVICTLRFHENGLAFLIHALGCCTVFLLATLSSKLHFYGAAFLLWELSTPFVYVRWVLLKLGRADSRLLLLNNMLGFLVFVCCRNIYGPYISWGFWRVTGAELAHPRPGGLHPAALYAFRAICITMNGLNYYWASSMLKLALGAQRPKPATKEV